MNYKKVPNIITGKDLDYLSDMFNWNFSGLKTLTHFTNEIQDEKINDLLKEIINLFEENIDTTLKILGGKYE